MSQKPVEIYLSQLNQNSQRVQMQALNFCTRILTDEKYSNYENFDWNSLRFYHISCVRAYLIKHEYSPNTANRVLAGLKSVMKSVWLSSECSNDEYSKAVSIKPVIGTSLPAGRMLEKYELEKLFQICRDDKSIKGNRDLALIYVMYSCGLRRAETCNLKMEDYNQEDRTLLIHGKRNKIAYGYLIDEAVGPLDDWIKIRGDYAGYIFTKINKWGKIYIERMNYCGIYHILSIRAGEAGLSHFSPHDIRRTFISRLLEMNVDVFTVAKLARHENVQITARYDRRSESVKREATKLLNMGV